MTTCECGRSARKSGQSHTHDLYRCERGHIWTVPRTPEKARDEAVGAVGRSNAAWIGAKALPAIRRALRRAERITSDDVWAELNSDTPPEPRAMGAAMMQAKRLGLIRPTPDYQKSRRVECHARPVRVWEVIRLQEAL